VPGELPGCRHQRWGDYWFVHCDVSESGLWFWRHESQEVLQHHRYLREYLEALRADLESPE
jgi:hypothetical protein